MSKIKGVIAQGKMYRVGDVTYDGGTLTRFEEADQGINEPRNGYSYSVVTAYDEKDEVALSFRSNDLILIYGGETSD